MIYFCFRMVLCASTAEKVELMNPPEEAQPGDR